MTLFRQKLAARVSPEELDKMAPEVWAQLQEVKRLVEKIADEQKHLLQLFDATDVAERRMLRAADEFRAFLSKVLFWVPVSRYGADWFEEALLSIGALVSPTQLGECRRGALERDQGPLAARRAGRGRGRLPARAAPRLLRDHRLAVEQGRQDVRKTVSGSP